MIKRILVALMGIMVWGSTCMAGNFDKVFNEFKSQEGVEYVKIPWLLAKLGGLAGSCSGVPLAGSVSGIRVITLDGCSQQVRDRFCNRVDAAAEGMEEALRVNDGGEKVRIWIKSDEKKISAVYVFSVEPGECDFVEIKGSFSHEEIAKMIEAENK